MNNIRATDYLNKNLEHDQDLLYVFMLIFESIRSISDKLDITKGYEGSVNIHGERQLAMDIQADQIAQKTLCTCNCIAKVASEEQEDAVELNGDKFCVVYDPLDGSSLINANMSIGSIFGIFPGTEIVGRKGEEMAGSVVAVYGPRTTVMVSWGDGLHEFVLEDEGFKLKIENIKIAQEFKYFAPGNLRATSDTPWYLKMMEYWMTEQYTLRYSGGMCADVNHILIKGGGVFTYPGSKDVPEGKLRLVYECNPMAYLVEQAGGCASDGEGRILEKTITSLHERTPIFIGSCKEVDLALQYLHDFS